MTNGQCVRVSTGAVVPDCADAVVQVEDTEIVKHDNKEELIIKIKKAPSRIGQDIRKPGDDMRKGDLLFDVGCILSAGEIGVINEIGLKAVAVYRRPKVCVMSTGNELVESMTEEIPPGCIRDSNRPQLLALFKSLGFKPIDAGIAPDRRSDLVVAIKNAFGYASVLVTSGGVSMGEHDLLKDILENDLGFKIHFGRVWMKPGMPATFATGVIGAELRCVFALPGNPVSSWACAHLFAAPLLRHLAGHLKIYNSRIYVKLADGVKLGERPEYKRAWLQMPDRMTGEMQDEFWKTRQETGQVQKEEQFELLPIAHITGGQLSSRLASTIGANVLLELPQKSDGLAQLERGKIVQAFVIAPI
ncbi:hypothetical protein WR25_03861 [Diploscapter pachys]|uniref:molybdopterin adenylyltransferase n=1 Tax=Diploscapter pachys TaxID=2018661 RepID=A0A2A2JN72_9BILA|nr:hypothetical protein WR25_03861 [Diploscapter pachys]